MEMIAVESSNVTAIGYSPGPGGKPGNLYVDFRHGKDRYVYADVPEATWNALQKASSKGEFIAKVVKGTYEFHKTEKPALVIHKTGPGAGGGEKMTKEELQLKEDQFEEEDKRTGYWDLAGLFYAGWPPDDMDESRYTPSSALSLAIHDKAFAEAEKEFPKTGVVP